MRKGWTGKRSSRCYRTSASRSSCDRDAPFCGPIQRCL